MINIPYKQSARSDKQMHPGLQFLTFIGIFAGIFFVGNIIGAGLVIALYGMKTFTALASLDMTVPHFMAAIWVLQTAGTTLPILIAPLLFAWVIVRDVPDYIKPTIRFPWMLMIVVLAVMFLSMPLIEFLSNLNQKMVLPVWLKWMKESEEQTQKLMEGMLKMNGLWKMLSNVLFIGLFTAIAEEFMFRGVLQTIFYRWTKNIHVAIWITAILFSAFHMEFFGFLPRLLLGLFFGYFVAWSGSIWTGVWAHFINNSTIVIVTYLFQQKIFTGDVNNQHVFNTIGYVISLVITFALLILYKKVSDSRKQQPLLSNGEELG